MGHVIASRSIRRVELRLARFNRDVVLLVFFHLEDQQFGTNREIDVSHWSLALDISENIWPKIDHDSAVAIRSSSDKCGLIKCLSDVKQISFSQVAYPLHINP